MRSCRIGFENRLEVESAFYWGESGVFERLFVVRASPKRGEGSGEASKEGEKREKGGGGTSRGGPEDMRWRWNRADGIDIHCSIPICGLIGEFFSFFYPVYHKEGFLQATTSSSFFVSSPPSDDLSLFLFVLALPLLLSLLANARNVSPAHS